MMKKALLTIALAAMMMPMAASAAVRGFIGFGPVYRPYWGPYGYWGPYWGPAYVTAYPVTGAVKVDTKMKDAQVFINGALAGTVGEVKTMHLRPGTYNISVKAPNVPEYNQKVYVAADKTVHLHPEF
jgi:hypothetical protein